MDTNIALLPRKWKGAGALLAVILCSGCPGEPQPDGGPGGGGGQAGNMGGGGGAGGSGGVGTGGGSGGGNGGGMGGGSTGGGGSAGAGGGAALVDLDVAVVRLELDGGLDPTFGTGGIVRLDLGTATVAGNRDLLWSMARDSQDRLVLFAGTRGEPPRVDSDRVIVRLNSDGTRDVGFATQGQFRFNLAGTADSARHGVVQADGKILAGGYAAAPDVALADGGFTTNNRAVILRLESNGTLDSTFADGGVAMPFPNAFDRTDGGADGELEAYNVALAPDGRYVTAGYGRTAATGTVDVLSVRLSSSGALDSSWNSNLGYLAFDLVGADDRARNMALLPDGRVVITGSATPTTVGVLDALVLMLTAGGQVDTSFQAGAGYKLYNFMGTDESFFGAAVSPNATQFAAAGWSGGGSNANEDATLLLMPLGGGAPAEVAQKVSLSSTANDRLFAVTYDAAARPVACGFVNVAGDNQMAVIRFTPSGVRDTTFGVDGLVQVNVAVGRGAEETARAVVVQSTGKIVVAGIFER